MGQHKTNKKVDRTLNLTAKLQQINPAMRLGHAEIIQGQYEGQTTTVAELLPGFLSVFYNKNVPRFGVKVEGIPGSFEFAYDDGEFGHALFWLKNAYNEMRNGRADNPDVELPNVHTEMFDKNNETYLVKCPHFFAEEHNQLSDFDGYLMLVALADVDVVRLKCCRRKRCHPGPENIIACVHYSCVSANTLKERAEKYNREGSSLRLEATSEYGRKLSRN
jgi:hypothetical protein